MSEYSSQVNLVNSPQETRKERMLNDHRKRGRWICFLFVVFMSFAFLFAMICIGAIYIQKLQDHMNHLGQRVDILEKTSTDTPCSCKCEEDKNNIKRSSEMRVKREAAEIIFPPESDHIKKEHHGISSHRIALVFGDPSKVGRSVDPDDPMSELQFVPSARRDIGCGDGLQQMLNRKSGDYLCKKKHKGQLDKMMFTRQNHYYNYFAKAKWMNRPESEENYVLQRDGKIKVKEDGIYIVHASVHFSDLGESDFPHYGVYKTDENGYKPKLISKCVVTVEEKMDEDDMGVYPCQAWQLVSLNKNDVVYLSIGGYSWFRIEKETFHLALIRLNGEKID